MLQLPILIVTAVANVLLGLFVLLKNSRSMTNRMFFGLTLIFALWAGANYISLHPVIFSQLTWIRIVLFFAAALNLFVYLTFDVFPRSGFGTARSKIRKISLYLTPLVMILTLTPFVFKALNISANGSASPIPAPGIVIFLLHTVGLLGGGLYLLLKKLKAATGRERQQLKFIFSGIVTSFGLIILTNLLAVILLNRSDLIPLAPTYTLFFSGFMAYAIVKHGFLDIRLIIARSVAYLLSLTLLVVPYIVLVIFLMSHFHPDSQLSTAELFTFSMIAVVFGLTFHPVRLIFATLTKKVFYRDSYDSQAVLDELSSLLAREINLLTIVTSSNRLINETLHPTVTRFVVFKDGEAYIDESVGGKSRRAIIRPEVDSFEKILILRDDTSTKEKRFLNLYDADILLKLKTNEETVGAIMLGPKQNGTSYTKQDIDFLTISENELAISVQNSRYFEQIQEFNVKLQKEVEQATAELRASNAKLKALDEAKDEFISMASHQLRTPLTSVKGYLSMVTDGDAGAIKPEQKRLLDEAFASSQRMVYLIADLLNVSRLRTGKFIIEPNEVDLADVVEQEINQLKPTARSRRLKVSYNKPDKFPKVMLDETKMRQVIMNFIDNAIYYTPAGGNIEIRLVAKKDSIEYTVRDDGIGVPKDDQPKLFTKFFRAGNARKSRPDGTGLGLYMAQRVVSAQGGSIIFKSTKGKGSIFGFSFPLKKIAVKPTKK